MYLYIQIHNQKLCFVRLSLHVTWLNPLWCQTRRPGLRKKSIYKLLVKVHNTQSGKGIIQVHATSTAECCFVFFLAKYKIFIWWFLEMRKTWQVLNTKAMKALCVCTRMSRLQYWLMWDNKHRCIWGLCSGLCTSGLSKWLWTQIRALWPLLLLQDKAFDYSWVLAPPS